MGISRSGLLLGNVIGPISGGGSGCFPRDETPFFFNAALLIAVTFGA